MYLKKMYYANINYYTHVSVKAPHAFTDINTHTETYTHTHTTGSTVRVTERAHK